MDPTQLHDAARRATEKALALAERLYGRAFHRPAIRFDLRGRNAGLVLFPTRDRPVIRYNPGLLAAEGDAFLRQVVPHEVAHLVARTLHGPRIRPHGAEWRAVMTDLGAEPVRCHAFDTSEEPIRRLSRFDYRCGCRVHRLTSIRHNRAMRGAIYRCRSCGGRLEPAG